MTVDWVPTDGGADHLTAAEFLKEQTGAKIAIEGHITEVEQVFKHFFGAHDLTCDGASFDRPLKDAEVLKVGGLRIKVPHRPGHTPACVSYKIGEDVFAGDTLFMPDHGTARADFPGVDAHALYRSIRRILSLPATTTL